MQLLIDGNNLAFRAYYTHRYLSTQGTPTGVIYGGLQSMRRLKEMFPRTKRMISCWDSRSNLRKKLHPSYKAQRKINSDRRKIFAQMPKLKEAFELIGVSIVERTGFEADDLLALLCRDKESLIVSNDQDLYQLLSSEKVKIFNPVNDTIFKRSHFIKVFGIEPEQWSMVLALAGKGSNNLPGLKGVGIKTAIKYLKDHKISDKLTDVIEKGIRTGRITANLMVIELPLAEFIPKVPRTFPDKGRFHQLCTKYQFSSILKEFKVWEKLFFQL